MTGSTHAQGAFSEMLIKQGGSPHDFGTGALKQEFLSENIQKHGRILGGNELTGSRSHRLERTRVGASYFFGSITKYISPAELDTWLINMIGNDESPTDTFNLTEDLPYFGLLFNREATTFSAGEKTFEYVDCKVDRWIVRGRAPEMGEDSQPDMISLQLFIIASDETPDTSWPVTPPTLGTTAAFDPYVFCDTTVQLWGASREISEFVIAGDNRLHARYTNSCTPDSIIPRDRIIQFRIRMPWNDTNDDLYAEDEDGDSASPYIRLTNGSVHTYFNFDAVQVEQITPAATRGREEIELTLNGTVRDVDADSDEVVIENDATP